jgi:ATP-dependent Lhr-like helicase
VLERIGRDELPMQAVETKLASPFASSLQFGFVMDWLYGDDAPRAEQRAALLSLDRALLDEVLGTEGADAETLEALEELLGRRRGTAPGSRARNADELSVLVDRAGDLTREEIAQRIASEDEGRKPMADPFIELLFTGRLVAIEIRSSIERERRFVLTENLPRYLSAFGTELLDTLRGGVDLATRGPEAVPDGFRHGTLTEDAARIELLTRLLALGGAVSIADIQNRYDIHEKWIERRLEAWRKHGRVVRGTFGIAGAPDRWASRRLLEIARRRELARARRQIQAVDLQAYARFVERWQHVHPDTRVDDERGITDTIRQLYGVSRSAEWWSREGLRARTGLPTSDVLSRLASAGELVWIGDPPAETPGSRVGAIRVLRRGTGRAWLAPGNTDDLTDDARAVRELLSTHGASFFDELLAASALPSRQLRDALRELVAVGIATSDSFESLRLVSRWRAMPRDLGASAPDPTRWIPTGGPLRERPLSQRRGAVRRLPRWRRPDVEGTDPDRWPGRWSLAHTPGILGSLQDEGTLAESIGRQWLDRYGVISREHWRRERPAIPWRSIYLELRRLELRGDVRRGYFVDGLSGVQFAKPEAVDLLRAEPAADAPVIILSAADPANIQNLPLAVERRDGFARVRGRGAWIATISGCVVLVAESGGRTMRVRPDVAAADVSRAAKAMAEYLQRRSTRPRDVVVETIDGEAAARSPHYPAFADAGFRRTTRAIRYLATV